jgi:hypothetical protein
MLKFSIRLTNWQKHEAVLRCILKKSLLEIFSVQYFSHKPTEVQLTYCEIEN